MNVAFFRDDFWEGCSCGLVDFSELWAVGIGALGEELFVFSSNRIVPGPFLDEGVEAGSAI